MCCEQPQDRQIQPFHGWIGEDGIGEAQQDGDEKQKDSRQTEPQLFTLDGCADDRNCQDQVSNGETDARPMKGRAHPVMPETEQRSREETEHQKHAARSA